MDNTTKLVWSVKLIHLANTTENVSFEWRISWWRLIAVYYGCLIWYMNISITVSKIGVDVLNFTRAGPVSY